MHKINGTRHPNIQIVAHNFGPIEKAEITLRPLTLFVGESHTGKTYLATLIFAMHRAFANLLNGIERPTEVLDAELERCFGTASVSALKRFTCSAKNQMKIALKFREKNRICWALNMSATASRTTVTYRPFIAAPRSREEEVFRQSQVYYLSAGRRELLRTLPDFLKRNNCLKEPPNGAATEIHRIAEALETEILGGAIEMIPDAKEGNAELGYRPNQAKQTLPMRRASSTVLELAPLVLLLRRVVRPGDLLIIEEPEAHLHPADQSRLAFTFARLIRAGVRVVVTTHSEWLLQQIGNLIREGELAGLRKKVSSPRDFVKKREVGVWLFQKGSPVEEIKYNRVDGVEPPEYLDVAEGLYNRAAGLQNRLEEAKGGNRFECE